MVQYITTDPDFVIRQPANAAEFEAFFRLSTQVFRPTEDQLVYKDARRRFVMNEPAYRPDFLWGAFLGETCVGGQVVFERMLCMGPARLRTGCIHSVFTHPDYRHQGISSAIMQEIISYAERERYALLFLHGIPNFYGQFGYSDVLEDTPRHFISRKLIPDTNVDSYTVREANVEDAPAVLALYQQHFAPYLASFAPTRTLQRQQYLLCDGLDVGQKVLLVCNARQEVQGYLWLTRRLGEWQAQEVVAEDWPATLALLQAHMRLLESEGTSFEELWWTIPPTDATFYLLAEHFPVRSGQITYPNRGWMARPVHLQTLLSDLLPLWQGYWQQRTRTIDWSGTIAFALDNTTWHLTIGPDHLYWNDKPQVSQVPLKLSQRLFTQLIFGFRPVSWIAAQTGQEIPEALFPVLDVLFPLRQAWVAGSDFF